MESRRKSLELASDRIATIGWLTVVLAFSLPLYRPWLTLAASLVMIFWLFSGRVRSSLVRLKSHRLTFAILAFLALNLASISWSSDPVEGLRYVAKYRYLLFVPILATAVPEVFRRRAAAAFQVGAIASVALSFGVALGILRIGDSHPGNPSPTMAHLDFTLVLAVASLLALTHALYGSLTHTARLRWIAASAATAVGMLVNIGRSGQLGFIAGLIVLVVRWGFDTSIRRLAVAVTVLLTAGVLIVGFSPPAMERMTQAKDELGNALVDRDFESNVGGRLAALAVAGRILSEAPILGTGVGGNMARFREVLDADLGEFKPGIYWYRHFHNQYAQIASELGIAGLASLAWIFWTLVKGPYPSRELAATAWVLAAVYLAGFLGEPYFHKQIPLITFALFAGLMSAAQLDETEEIVGRQRTARSGRHVEKDRTTVALESGAEATWSPSSRSPDPGAS